MWTIIPKDKYNKYIWAYSELAQYNEEIKLHETNEYIFLPRRFFYNYPSPNLILHRDKTWEPQPLNRSFTKELRDYQPPIVQPFIDLINQNNFCGGLQARPGAGKTVMAINIACQTNKKTLICIDNNNLLSQWKESILNFTNCDESDIGIIQGDQLDLDKPFTIAMVQTLVSRVKRDINKYYKLLTSAGFGIVFLDEYHQNVSGPKYATASLLFNTPCVIGLSATPYGQGLSHILMYNVVGDIISKTKDYDLIPKVKLVLYDSGLSAKHNKSVMMLREMFKQRARYNKIVVQSEKYHQIVYKITNDLVSRNHKVITIAFTTDQVSSLSKYLLERNIPNIQFYSKQRKLDKENDSVLVATYQFAGAGFDFKELSGCIIACPLSGKKSLIQVIGRVLRECQNKQAPEVYILIDVGFSGIFLREMSRIDKIISNEFGCIVDTINM